MLDAARAGRDFLVRTVRFLAQSGICQFLDIGTGLPTSPNVHEVAQSVHPDARVVYVDNDHCKSGCTRIAEPVNVACDDLLAGTWWPVVGRA
jgi:hypothetical protein